MEISTSSSSGLEWNVSSYGINKSINNYQVSNGSIMSLNANTRSLLMYQADWQGLAAAAAEGPVADDGPLGASAAL